MKTLTQSWSNSPKPYASHGTSTTAPSAARLIYPETELGHTWTRVELLGLLEKRISDFAALYDRRKREGYRRLMDATISAAWIAVRRDSVCRLLPARVFFQLRTAWRRIAVRTCGRCMRGLTGWQNLHRQAHGTSQHEREATPATWLG